MSALEQAAAEAEAASDQKALGSGRALVWASLLPFVVLEAVAIPIELSRAGAAIVGTVVRLGLEGALIWMTLRGSKGARQLLSFLYGAGCILGLVLATQASGLRAGFAVGIAMALAFGVWVLVFSGSARAYLETQAGDSAREGERRR